MAANNEDAQDLDQAADELRRFAVRFKAVLALPDVLDRIGSVTRAVAEGEGRLAAIRKDADAAAAEIEVAKASVKTVRSDAAKAMSQANAKAEAAIAEANAQASQIVAQAKAEADKRVADAEAKAQSIEDATTAATQALDGMNADIAAANTELDRINGVIAEAKAKLGA